MSNSSIEALIEYIKKNSSKVKLIDILTLLSKEKYCHLKHDILNLSFDNFSNPLISQEECINIMIKNKDKINNSSISELQKIVENCDRLILNKAIKFLEEKHNPMYVMKSEGIRRAKKYTLVLKEEINNTTQ